MRKDIRLDLAPRMYVGKEAKKVISVFFALLIVLSTIPGYALAIENDETDFRIYPVVTASDITNQLKTRYQQTADSKIHSKIKSQLQTLSQKPNEKIRVVLRVKNDEQLAHVSNLIRNKGGHIKGKYKIGDVITADVPAGNIISLAQSNSVDEIAPEFQYQAFLDQSIPNLGIEEYAWDNGITGKGIKIAILDTGIDYAHEMFDNTQIISQSFVGETSIDANGHGTHCAGIAAGNGEYKGVAKEASLINSKVLDSKGIGTTSSIIAGINWALEQDADIISMSFGSAINEFDGPLAATIKEAIAQNVTFIAASGNCNKGCGGFYGVTFPGSMEEVITVGAVDDNNAHASFSSGQDFQSYIKPDVVAYGVGIISSTPNNNYQTKSGTSMSTPHIAGIAALILEANPDLTQTQIKQVFQQKAIDLGADGKDIQYGSGLVNIEGLFSGAVDNATQPDTPEDITNETIDTSLKITEVNYNENLHLFETQDFQIIGENIKEAVIEVKRQESQDPEEILFVNYNPTKGWYASYNIRYLGRYEFTVLAQNEISSDSYEGYFDVTDMPVDVSDLLVENDIGLYRYNPMDYSIESVDDMPSPLAAYYEYENNSVIVKITPYPTQNSLLYYLDNYYPKDTWENTLIYRDQSILAIGNKMMWFSSNYLVSIDYETESLPTEIIGIYLAKFPSDYNQDILTNNEFNQLFTETGTMEDNFSAAETETEPALKDRGNPNDEALPYDPFMEYLEETDYTQQGLCWSDSDCTLTDYCDGDLKVYDQRCASYFWCVKDNYYDCNNFDYLYCSGDSMMSHDTSCYGSDGSAYCGYYPDTEDTDCNDFNEDTSISYYCSGDEVWKEYYHDDYTCGEDNEFIWCEIDSGNSGWKYEKQYTCGADQYCSGGSCYNADITSAYWSVSSTTETSTVTMYVKSNFNSGRSVGYDIYEDDYWPANPDYITSKSGTTDSNGDNSKTWQATYQVGDGWIPFNTYFFTASIGSKSKDSGHMSVTQTCFDKDGDGYYRTGSCSGTDCNDNDASIHPGASESCNQKDDDCDGYIDEDGACSCSDCGIGVTNFCDLQECLDLGDCYFKDIVGIGFCYDAPELGHGDYCLYKTQHGWKCDNNEYDCDYNSECSSANCAGGILGVCLGVECGCCPSDEEWDSTNNICYGICKPTAAYWSTDSAVEGDTVTLTVEGPHCSNTDTARVKVMEVDIVFGSAGINDTNETNSTYGKQGFWDWVPGNDDDVADFGERTFSDGKIEITWTAIHIDDQETPIDTYRIAAENAEGDIYEGNLIIRDKDANQKCIDRGHPQGTCSLLEDTNSYGKCIDKTIYKCIDFGDVYCWDDDTICSADEDCMDSSSGPAKCITSCDLTSASWNASQVDDQEIVTLTVTGDSDCNGDPINFEIWEKDCGYDYSAQGCADEFGGYPQPSTFVDGKATTTWTAEWQYDGLGDVIPEYYFIGTVGGSSTKTIRSAEPNLEVISDKTTCEDYPDTWGSCPLDEWLVGNTICAGEEKTHPYKCEELENHLRCYHKIVNCTTSEYCRDPWSPTQGAQCFPRCNITNAYWSETHRFAGQEVTITVEGNCLDGETAHVKVLEVDYFFGLSNSSHSSQGAGDWFPGNDDDVPTGDFGELPFSNGTIKKTWTTFYVNDSQSPRDTYRIEAKNDHGKVYSGDLIITQETYCGDGLCNGNETALTCPQDCFTAINVEAITRVDPSPANPGQEVEITALLKNKGTLPDSEYVEAAIVPESWAGIAYPDEFIVQEGVQDNTPVCPENEYYDSKLVELQPDESTYVTFTVKAPTEDSVDACDLHVPKRSAWDDKFRVIVGTYENQDGGSYTSFKYQPDYYVGINESCSYPYGTSADCSCFSDEYNCTINEICIPIAGSSGKCVPVGLPCEHMPDGSSEECSCSSNDDCTAWDTNTYCSFSQGWPRCLPLDYEDQCPKIDEIMCSPDNNLYRCEQQEKFKDWMLVRGCSVGEHCSESEGACTPLGNYDMVIDNAPPGVVVNKQPYTILEITIDVKGALEPGMKLEYDDFYFSLIEGESCANNDFQYGENKCYFIVDSFPGKTHILSFGDDAQRINIIGDTAYIAYLTDEKQLRKRYKDSSAVNLLFSKLYEEAAANDGVVHDLGVQFAYLPGYDAEHPFDFAFNQYSEDRIYPRMIDNSYSNQVSIFVQNYLSLARNIVVIGDDYVVPHMRDIYSLSDPYTLNSKVVKRMYTDQNLIQRYTQRTYRDIDIVFRSDDASRGNEVKIILPNYVNTSMRSAIESLKSRLISEGLVDKRSYFEELQGSSVNCNDFDEFSDAWLFDALDVPIIIGTVDTNPALNCYPFYSEGSEFENVISIEPSVWNKKGSAIVMNTNDPEVINKFSNIVLYNKTYEDLHGRGYMYIHDLLTGTTILIGVVSFGVGLIPAAAGMTISGIKLATIVIVADLTIAVPDFVDNCAVRHRGLPEGTMQWITCGAAASPILSYGLGRLISKIIGNIRVNRLLRVAGEATGSADEVSKIRSAALAFATTKDAGDILSKIPKDQYESFLKTLAKGMAKESDWLGSKFVQSFSKVLAMSRLRRSVLRQHDEVLDLLGDVVAKHADEGEKVLESIAKIASRNVDEATGLLKIIRGTDDAWNTGSLDNLQRYYPSLTKQLQFEGRTIDDFLSSLDDVKVRNSKLKLLKQYGGNYDLIYKPTKFAGIDISEEIAGIPLEMRPSNPLLDKELMFYAANKQRPYFRGMGLSKADEGGVLFRSVSDSDLKAGHLLGRNNKLANGPIEHINAGWENLDSNWLSGAKEANRAGMGGMAHIHREIGSRAVTGKAHVATAIIDPKYSTIVDGKEALDAWEAFFNANKNRFSPEKFSKIMSELSGARNADDLWQEVLVAQGADRGEVVAWVISEIPAEDLAKNINTLDYAKQVITNQNYFGNLDEWEHVTNLESLKFWEPPIPYID